MTRNFDILHARILVVDDLDANARLLVRILASSGYRAVTSTTNPREVCERQRADPYDLILLDLRMPGMSGFEVMEGLRALEPDGCLPVVVITSEPDEKLPALRAGARDFIAKPFELAEVLARVHNMLEMRLLQKDLHRQNGQLEQRVAERTADLRENHLETLFAMTRAAEYKDEDTGAHVQRISHYSRELARLLGQDVAFIDRIFFASPMHDVGKIGIPDHILLKPSSLAPDEWEVMKGHSAIGAEILGRSRSPYLAMGAEIALNHHERWDGGGYPNGRRGEGIPLPARIMNICDIYDALRSQRPYKPAFDHAKAMDIITQGDGRTQPGHFDPAIHAAFRQNHATFRDIFESRYPES